MKNLSLLFTAVLLCAPSCTSSSKHDVSAPRASDKIDDAVASSHDTPERGAKRPTQEDADVSALTESSVTPFIEGSEVPSLSDLYASPSDRNGYSQKWEFYLYAKPYALRIKFELSNFAFSKNEGKIKVRLTEVDDKDKEINAFALSETFDASEWKVSKDKLDLNFGNRFKLFADNDHYVITGEVEGKNFEYRVPIKIAKPGTGNVYFGKERDKFMKYHIMTYGTTAKGRVDFDGQSIEAQGDAYANHYVTDIPVHEAYSALLDARKRIHGLLIEYRYYITSETYGYTDFGYVFVAYKGIPLFNASRIDFETAQTWLDEDNYGYSAINGFTLNAFRGNDRLSLTVSPTSEPEVTDPFAKLSYIERSVASKFAKPIEYSFASDWKLHLRIANQIAEPSFPGSYSLNILRQPE